MESPSTSTASSGRPHSRFRPIHFRRATSASLLHSTPVTPGVDSDAVGTTNAKAGQEAREFYESLISSDPLPCNDEKSEVSHTELLSHKRKKDKNHESRKRKLSQNTDKMPHLSPKQRTKLVNSLLQGAQNGDLKKVKDALKQGCDINSTDDFSWTAIMCACHSGQIDIVKYLLKRLINRPY